MNSLEDRLQALIELPAARTLSQGHDTTRKVAAVVAEAIIEIERLREFEFMYQNLA